MDTSEGASSPPRHWGITSYGANAGRRSYRRADQTNDGPFIHNIPRRFADITDGTINTIFVGERLHRDPVFDIHPGREPGRVGLVGVRGRGRRAARARPSGSTGRCRPPTQADYDLRINVFGSGHTGGANFALGDGSVRFIAGQPRPGDAPAAVHAPGRAGGHPAREPTPRPGGPARPRAARRCSPPTRHSHHADPHTAAWLSLSLAALLAGLLGGPPLAEVSGKVTMNGKPLKNVKVDFHPDPDKGTNGTGSTGTTDEDGKFTLTYGDGQARARSSATTGSS